MSLQGLVSGSECALPHNPLVQVLKHTDSDRSLQRDRVAGPSTSRLHHLPQTSTPLTSASDTALARQFFDNASGGTQQFSPHTHQRSPPLELVNRPDLHTNTHSHSGTPPPALHEAWGRSQTGLQLRQQADAQHSSAAWAAEFERNIGFGVSSRMDVLSPQPEHAQFSPSNYSQTPFLQNVSPMGMGMGMGMHGMGMHQHPFSPMVSIGKGKGRLLDSDFDAAFAEFSGVEKAESAKIEEMKEGDVVGDLESAMRSANLEDVKEGHEADANPVLSDDFQKVWEHLQMSEQPPPKSDMARWEAEFNQLMTAQRDDGEEGLDYDETMKEAWESGMGMYGDLGKEGAESSSGGQRFNEEGVPMLGDYIFEPDNKYLTNPPPSCLDAAKALLAANGSLTEAALLLEAAIQGDELGEGGYETWVLLGETRSMDEREEAGMRAMREGVRRAEMQEGGGRGEGLLSLAISYTNESYERASNATLLRWLRAAHPTLLPPTFHSSSAASTAALSQSPWASAEHVKEAFLAVARAQHAQGILDADVQTGLGVLFYTEGQFERARDCFESALGARPKDYLLWNRLGSSLSNGSKPEEALGAYREALNLRPTYTRAIYNVGVACLNIGAHKEAAEHFLSALSLQESAAGGNGSKSQQLWFTLRRALFAMDRPDLADRAKEGGDVESFRAEGFDF